MKQTLAFLSGLLLILVVGLVYGIAFQKNGVTVSRLSPKDLVQLPVAQQAEQRTWRAVAFSDPLTLGQEGKRLIRPLLIRYDSEGNVYVADYGDMKIKKFARDGAFMNTYGQKVGNDPGDIINMTDYVVRDNGDVWVCDPPNDRITIFNNEGVVKHVVRPEKEPYRIRLTRDSTLIVRDSYPDDSSFFSVYRPDGQTAHRFGRLLYNQADNLLYLDGVMLADAGTIIYALTYVGILAAYTLDGKQQFLVKTIDDVGFPELIENANGRKWIDRQAPVATVSMMKLEDKVYVFKVLYEAERRRTVLDVYDSTNGQYRYSLDVTEAAHDAVHLTVSPDHLYVVKDSAVVRWGWQEKSEDLAASS